MAVTLDEYLPFDSGPGASVQESGWRDMMKHMLGSASGVIRGFGANMACLGDSSGMQVKVSIGECFMRGHYGNNTSQKILPIASNSSGNPRIDIAVIRCHFGNNNIVLDIVQGTPATTPSAPGVTQNTSMWETKLADIAVANGAVTITAANVTDQRVYTSGVASYNKTNSVSVPSGTYTNVPFNTTELATGDVSLNSAGTIATVNRAGIWQLSANVGFEPLASGGRRIIIADSSDNSYSRSDTPTMGGTEQTYLSTSTTEQLAAGATVKVRVWQNGTGAINTVAGWANLVLTWIGP
jgi:hypothetical protein